MTSGTLRFVILAAGVALGGLFVGGGFARGRAANRTVTVKGVAERTVQADIAIWPLRVVTADDDLTRANATLQASVGRVRQFLARQGLDTTQLVLQDFAVSDAQADQNGSNNGGRRYVMRQTIIVRSTQPAVVRAASQRVAELVSEGVVLSSGGEYGNGGPTFVFSGLNALKPAMISEATARAREAAEQFARDSRSALRGIQSANQGTFEILPRDQANGISEESQVAKTVRVVSTVTYALGG
jgi:hypothetical protein